MLGARYRSYAEVGHQNTQNIPEVTSQNNMVVFRAHGLSLSISGGNEASDGQEELTLVWHGWSRSVWHTMALILASCLVILAAIRISSARLGWDPYFLSRDGIFCLEWESLKKEKMQTELMPEQEKKFSVRCFVTQPILQFFDTNWTPCISAQP